MIDIKQIRENPEKFKKAAKDKHFDIDIDRLELVDEGLKHAKNVGKRGKDKGRRRRSGYYQRWSKHKSEI